jgi:hypothetical protein
MENVVEVYRALVNGETLIMTDGGGLIKVEGGNFAIKSKNSDTWQTQSDWNVYNPSCYEIYKEPQWYDGDLSEGVSCRVRQYPGSEWRTDVIYRFSKNEEKKFKGLFGPWNIAEPLDLTQPLLPQLQLFTL